MIGPSAFTMAAQIPPIFFNIYEVMDLIEKENDGLDFIPGSQGVFVCAISKQYSAKWLTVATTSLLWKEVKSLRPRGAYMHQ